MRTALGFGTILAFLLLTGCQSAMSSAEASNHSKISTGEGQSEAAQWPLKFNAHYFGGHCFDTQSCVITYQGGQHGTKDRPSPSLESYGRPLSSLLSAGRGPIKNFPPPASVVWQSKDGTPLDAQVDIAAIFRDEIILHNVTQDDAIENPTGGAPSIIIEVNDRTINVYMQDMIGTKSLRDPANPHSNFRNDLVKAFSRTY